MPDIKPEELKLVCGHCGASVNYMDSKIKAFKCGTSQYVHQGEWHEHRGDVCIRNVLVSCIGKSTKLIERMFDELATHFTDETITIMDVVLTENKAMSSLLGDSING